MTGQYDLVRMVDKIEESIITGVKNAFEGYDDNFFVVIFDDVKNYYAQFLVFDGQDDFIYCEITGNEFIPEEFQLNEMQVGALISTGWELVDSGNFSKSFEFESISPREIASEVISIFKEVYNIPAEIVGSLEVTIG